MLNDYLERYAPLLDEVRAFNDGQISEHHATPLGGGWNGPEAQRTRFDQLLRALPQGLAETATVNDFGCGYGALLQYLEELGRRVVYRGYDVSSRSLSLAREINRERPDIVFKPLADITPAIYSLASGVFGLRFGHSDDYWWRYVVDTLDVLRSVSVEGFAFNLLTSYSDADLKRPELYYADPGVVFDLCKRRYAKRVALYHDYPLFDFTVVVRLG